MEGAHFEVMRGNISQARKYCMKEGSGGRIEGCEVYEFGIAPETQGKRSDLHSCQDRLISGDLSFRDLPYKEPGMHAKYKRHWETLEDRQKRKIYRTEMPECIWLWGPSGAGKSHALFNEYAKVEWIETGELYLFDLEVNKWFDGFDPSVCKVLGLNEFRGQVKFPTLMRWADKWPCTVPIRGRESVPLKFDKLVITCIKHPKDVYRQSLDGEDQEPWEQFQRRFKIIKVNRL